MAILLAATAGLLALLAARRFGRGSAARATGIFLGVAASMALICGVVWTLTFCGMGGLAPSEFDQTGTCSASDSPREVFGAFVFLASPGIMVLGIWAILYCAFRRIGRP